MLDVIVLGVGTMGSAACDALARRGASVLGIDRFSPPHEHGSHHGDTRLFRVAYYEHPDYVPLLQRAHSLWKERLPGVLVETGILYMGSEKAELISASRNSALKHGVPHELISLSDVARRFPQFRLPGNFVGLLEPNAGFVYSSAAIQGMVRSAESHGAQVRRRERVLRWEAAPDRVQVHTDAATHAARRLILTAGVGAPALLHDLGVRLTTTRQPVAWFKPTAPSAFAAASQGKDGFPCWAIANRDGSLHYGFPLHGDETALKAAHHMPGPPIDPDHTDRTITPAEEADIRRILEGHIPGADGPLHRSEICRYTNTPDSHFIIDRHPAHDNVIVCSACSGHGFKFAPVTGEALADLALHGQSKLPIGFLGLSRFRR